MLFTTVVFALLYLPVTLAGFFVAARWSRKAAAGWLLIASLFFYGFWMPVFTWMLLSSIAVNFLIGLQLMRARVAVGGREAVPLRARLWLAGGVAVNLGLLGYFKYANFLVDNLNAALNAQWSIGTVVLPIGISFYCFTQIAYLVDTCQGKVREANIVHYGLFVTYFPHLIAGPVLHHAQMMPQFADGSIYTPRAARLVAGLLIFCIGLFKKIILADGISPYADAVFKAAETGQSPSLAEAWLGAAAYTLQLYFDFSGYSDMAIGLSWMFNIRLPINFDSPYRATSISDFWRRWHISLSTFLRDYLYIALGGNRKGELRRNANLMVTMLLGGLWHGASWSFVIWGGLHGLYLLVNHAFRDAVGSRWRALLDASPSANIGGWVLTMLAVVVGWVFFRAETLSGALRMLDAMVGRGTGSSEMGLLWNAGLQASTGAAWAVVLSVVAVIGPNSNGIGVRLLTLAERPGPARAAFGAAGVLFMLFLLTVNTARDSVSAFIYFNF